MTGAPEDAAVRLAAIVEFSNDAIISVDPDLRITSWNPAAERMFGYGAGEAIGQPVQLIAPPELEQRQVDALTRVVHGDSIPPFETIRRGRDGTSIRVVLSLSPIRNRAGAVIGVSAFLRRLTDEGVEQRAAARLAAIVESSDDTIVSKDLNGIVTSWNRAAERMFGFTATEMVGQSIRKIIPPERQLEEDDVLARIRRGERVDHFETVRQRKDGTRIPISLTISPIRDESGRVIGASKIARDISERKEMEAERAQLFARAHQQAAITAKINEVGEAVASTLDRDAIAQVVTDTARAVTGAEFGAFFYRNTEAGLGEQLQLYALSGAPRDAFDGFPHPRATGIFGPTFRGEGIVRIDDVTTDPRYGKNPPYQGMPEGHLPVRSYLAVPVKTRAGEVLGGLLFAHSEPGRFSPPDEQLAAGIASWASVALENAHLFVAAREANRLKDEFLATLSHELRTPLNAILGYARMLKAGHLPADRQPRAVDTIERNALSLARIIEDVLDVSRIVSGKVYLDMQVVELSATVRDAVDAVMPSAEEKGVAIHFCDEAGTAPILGDVARLQQVLWNLLSNAVKFTPRGGAVHVDMARDESRARIVVRDTGIGIAPSFLSQVFERFRQADSGVTRERGGLGLGLSIARDLVQLHGGTIAAHSEGEGRGASFTIDLPIAAQTTAEAVSQVR